MSTLYGEMFFSEIFQTCHRAEFKIKLNYAAIAESNRSTTAKREGQRVCALYGFYLRLAADSGGSPPVTNHAF